MLLLASWAASLSSPLGGFLCGVIIPLPMYPLSAIHPEGSIANTKQDKPLLIRLTCGGGRSPRGAHSGWIGIGLRVIIVA